jgi:hypothetical protein
MTETLCESSHAAIRNILITDSTPRSFAMLLWDGLRLKGKECRLKKTKAPKIPKKPDFNAMPKAPK